MRKLQIALALVLTCAACAREKAPPPDRRTVTVNLRALLSDGHPLTEGRISCDTWWSEFGHDYLAAKGRQQTMALRSDGRLTLTIDQVRPDQNWMRIRLQHVPAGTSWPFEEDREQACRDLHHPIANELDWGEVRFSAPSSSRPYVDASDEDLEARVRASWELGHLDYGENQIEWPTLLSEVIRRKGQRWETLMQELLDGFLHHDARSESGDDGEHGVLELLTALRRHKGQPDPVVIRVLRGSKLVVDVPARPVLYLSIENRDVERVPVTVTGDLFLRECWRLEARLADGSMVRRIRSPEWGSSRVAIRHDLEFGESFVLEVPIEDQLEPFRGPAEMHVTYCDRCFIAGELDLDGLILFHGDPVNVDVRPPRSDDPSIASHANLWPLVVDEERMRALAKEAEVPLLEAEGQLLVAEDGLSRMLDVFYEHDALLERVDAWVRQETGARRTPDYDAEFAKPGSGEDAVDGAHSVIAARLWLQEGRAGGARFVLHVREHDGW